MRPHPKTLSDQVAYDSDTDDCSPLRTGRILTGSWRGSPFSLGVSDSVRGA